MLEGVRLLRGILLAQVLDHGAAAGEEGMFIDLIMPGDGPVRWPKQCGQMLAAADGRSASAGAAVEFRTSYTVTVTLRKQSEDKVGAGKTGWLVPPSGDTGEHGVGVGEDNPHHEPREGLVVHACARGGRAPDAGRPHRHRVRGWRQEHGHGGG